MPPGRRKFQIEQIQRDALAAVERESSLILRAPQSMVSVSPVAELESAN